MLVALLATTTTSTQPVQPVAADPVPERLAWILIAAVAGLIVHETWRTWRTRQDQCTRDRMILSAVLRELSMIVGVATSIHRDINREREMMRTSAQWRLKPLVRFPTTIYGLVTHHIPAALVREPNAVTKLIALQTQCEYSNALADEHQKWKIPDARGQPDQLETILSFHEPMMESVNSTLRQCAEVQPLIVAAGDAIGGLNLGPRIDGQPKQAEPSSESTGANS